MMKTKKNRPADHPVVSLLERRLNEFSTDKSKENYVRLLDAFRCTDVLVPSLLPAAELPFENEGVLTDHPFKPDVIYFSSSDKRLMPVFSNQ